MKKLLVVFAHPDDESLIAGGTIAKYVKNGWSVHSLCLTRGKAGQTGTYGPITPDQLGIIRQKEYLNATHILGIKKADILDYPDGDLSNVPHGKLENEILGLMLKFCPDVVITNEPQGVTNHPDHIKACLSTTVAFQRYVDELTQTKEFVSDVSEKEEGVKQKHFFMAHKKALTEERFADAVDELAEPKLYYACVPSSVISFLQKIKLASAQLHNKPLVGTPDKKITTVINLGGPKQTKIKAILAYESQIGTFMTKVAVDVLENLLKNEYFILRYHGVNEVYMGNDDRVADRL